jgi:glycerol-3-phosphate acyltransferase PlsY
MSYTVGWIGGVATFGVVLLFLIAPWFAAIAVVVATIAVLVVALAALVAVVALAAAALASPYLLVRSVRHRRGPTIKAMDRLAERHPGAVRRPDRLRVLGGADAAAFAHDERGEAGALLENAARDAA